MNKKKNLLKIAGLACLMLPSMFLISACGHTHNFSQEWSCNETHHYHVCDGCDEISGNAEHSFGGWTYNEENPDVHSKTCGECGYVVSEAHNKQFVPYDGNLHMVTCQDCSKPGAPEQHHFGSWEIDTDNPEEYHARFCADCNYKERSAHNRASILSPCSDCEHEFAVDEELTETDSHENGYELTSSRFVAEDGLVKVYKLTTKERNWLNRKLKISLIEKGGEECVNLEYYKLELFDANKNKITTNLTESESEEALFFANPTSNTTYYIAIKIDGSQIQNWVNIDANPEHEARICVYDEDKVDAQFAVSLASRMDTDTFKYVATDVPTGSELKVKVCEVGDVVLAIHLDILKLKADGTTETATYTNAAGYSFKLIIEEDAVYYFRLKSKIVDVQYSVWADFAPLTTVATADIGDTSESGPITTADNETICVGYRTNSQSKNLVITIEESGIPVPGYTLRIVRVNKNRYTLIDHAVTQEGDTFVCPINAVNNCDMLIYITVTEAFGNAVVKITEQNPAA